MGRIIFVYNKYVSNERQKAYGIAHIITLKENISEKTQLLSVKNKEEHNETEKMEESCVESTGDT